MLYAGTPSLASSMTYESVRDTRFGFFSPHSSSHLPSSVREMAPASLLGSRPVAAAAVAAVRSRPRLVAASQSSSATYATFSGRPAVAATAALRAHAWIHSFESRSRLRPRLGRGVPRSNSPTGAAALQPVSLARVASSLVDVGRFLSTATATEGRPDSSSPTGTAAVADGESMPDTSSPSVKESASSKGRRLSKIPIKEVLDAKHTLRWVEPVISQNSTVQEAIVVATDRGLSGMMVVDLTSMTSSSSRERGRVVGMTTSRDLLRVLSSGFKEGKSADELVTQKVSEFMTPLSQVVYARPDETIGTCRTIMAKVGIKSLPILSEGRVEGIISSRDMAEFGLEAKEGTGARGGKKNYLKHVSERVGLSAGTSMAEPPAYLKAQISLGQKPLFINIGVAELPHPFKTPESCGMNARDHGPRGHSMDPDLSEDAHFVAEIDLPDDTGVESKHITYLGVADGVGSWREYGIDPREFGHKLMEECENVLRGASAEKSHCPPEPAEVLAQAYERVKKTNIIGSSTACVARFDNAKHQLHFSNLGDSGIVVLRHIDSDVAGALKRNRTTPRTERKSDLRVAFVSQQQLRSFNHPYQFGWTGEELDDDESSFKTAADSCNTSIHIRRGDIIIMATDGLFDNVDIDDIAKIALDWEQKNGFIRGGDIAAREMRWSKGNSMSVESCETLPHLAQALCEKARENSLDSSVDSPFAILAKENDIMWSGGMPDDCTVIALHVVGSQSGYILDRTVT